MRSIQSKKVWVIAIAILFFTLSIFSPSIDYQNALYNAGNTLNYRLTTNISTEAVLLKEQYSNYPALFVKPVKLIISFTKYLYLNFKVVNSKFIDTQYCNTSIIAIVLFSMFYQLSRTSSEKADGLQENLTD